MLAWGDSPIANTVPQDWLGKICHATLVLAGESGTTSLSGSDVPPSEYTPHGGFQILLEPEDLDHAERIFQAMSANGGTILMPMQKTFWSESYGIMIDRFGVQWEISL